MKNLWKKTLTLEGEEILKSFLDMLGGDLNKLYNM